ncbi:DUF2975 domain-containing protein [Mucilaginibacter myungsuensis]|uniref:DUF2975 domain-containing protein n=1 Tax=Mucilaginibacter myungsuensis TaxID=649104 RepID=A0A929PY61_9SPHI|nr:DUF2975 domain-containing protein [Mucilaginibacter myungsuensis]MBE9663844.1 DUF2975 domain-containing protein [Mucilaginibacter myungsuensis]MDN3598441.1 DUF2975 domain-containing protein [Mucilaginibacter myungsuensis]
MRLVRIISAIAFYLTRILSAGYILTTLHLLISVIFTLPTLKMLPQNRFAICYPFTDKPFLLGSVYEASYIAEMVMVIGFYGLFFWLLGNVFKTFRQTKLFTVQGIRHLKLFYIANLIVCPIMFAILGISSQEDLPYGVMVTAHIIMGIFALFIAAIFQQGVNLQKDQDLYI